MASAISPTFRNSSISKPSIGFTLGAPNSVLAAFDCMYHIPPRERRGSSLFQSSLGLLYIYGSNIISVGHGFEQAEKSFPSTRKERHITRRLAPSGTIFEKNGNRCSELYVLIIGESGVGKEIIPRVIHDNSPRKREKYFAINCGSIPEGTIDSELFGHEKGSYTGAIGESEGYFGIANKGTLFLDEVGELPMATQARLLRVLETGEYIRVGGQEIRKTNVRIVAATNVNMRKAISEGKFREDLYYRLNTIPINMPPLRERGNDILLLFRLFAMQMAEKYKLPKITLDDEAKQVMRVLNFPFAPPWFTLPCNRVPRRPTDYIDKEHPACR